MTAPGGITPGSGRFLLRKLILSPEERIPVMETTTFISTRKRNGHTFQTEVTVTRTPGSVSELRMTRGRYWDYMGDHITEVSKVTVSQRNIYSNGDVEDTSYDTTYTEIVTPFGKGCIIDFESGPELCGFIPTTGKALIYGCWKKYGQYRGHAIAWFKAHKLNVNTKSRVYHTCPAHIYDAAKGGNTYKAA